VYFYDSGTARRLVDSGHDLGYRFHKSKPTYDWVDAGFGKGFALFLLWVAGFQLNYMYLYVLKPNLRPTTRFLTLATQILHCW
jgi:hypothetical protein